MQSQRLSVPFDLLRNGQDIFVEHNIHIDQLQAQHNESSQLQKETGHTKTKKIDHIFISVQIIRVNL